MLLDTLLLPLASEDGDEDEDEDEDEDDEDDKDAVNELPLTVKEASSASRRLL